MSCLKWRWIIWLLRVIGVVLILLGYNKMDLMVAIGVVILIISVAIGVRKWRCPGCNRYLPESLPILTEHCPYCGESLD